MPRQLPLTHYGETYCKILTTALTNERKFTFKKEQSALCIRRTFYNYRYALRDAGFAGDASALRKWNRFMKLQMCVSGAVLRIHVKPKTLVQEMQDVL